MKNVLILYDSKYSKEIRNYISNNPDYIYYGIYVNDDLYVGNDNVVINFLSQRDYFSFKGLSYIDKLSITFARNWYNNSETDITNYKGISLGRVIEYDMMKFLCQNIKTYNYLKKVIKKENINTIFISGDNKYFNKSAELIAKSKKVTVEYCGDTNLKNECICEKSNTKSNLKKICSNYIDYIFNIINKLRRQRSGLLFFYSERNEYLITNLSKYFHITLISLKTIYNPHIILNKNITIIKLTPADTLEIEEKNKNDIVDYLFNKCIDLLGREINDLLLLTDIKSYLYNTLNIFLKYMYPIERIISCNKFGLVIVNQDFLGIPRLIVEYANSYKIDTLVLQHGAYGFYPYFISPISKYVGIWGKGWGEWLKRIGADESKLVITGESYYDKYIFKIKNHIKRKKHVILIPFTNNVTISALGEYSKSEMDIINVLNALSYFNKKFDIVLKMRHNSDIKKGIDIVSKSFAKDVKVIGKTNNYKLINKIDIIITKGSTMGFEGLLNNKIVLIENFFNYRPKYVNPYAYNNSTIEFSCKNELIKIIEELINNINFLKNVRENRNKFLQQYYINSSSTLRTLNVINNILK